MKTINSKQTVVVPKGVEVSVSNRTVTVKGKRGTLKRSFQGLKLILSVATTKKGQTVSVEKWFGKRKEVSAVRTICTHITNMIKGVTYGYQYKMRAVYAHFPINCVISKDARSVEIRNFLGQKHIRKVVMSRGVTITSSPQKKDEFLIEGTDIEAVSQSAAAIQQSTNVREKDIRKFLDGMYVSEKG